MTAAADQSAVNFAVRAETALQPLLAPADRRQLVRFVVRAMTSGCVCSTIAVLAGVLAGTMPGSRPAGLWLLVTSLALPPGCGLLAFVITLFRRKQIRQRSARAVDHHFRLQDHTETTLAFLELAGSQPGAIQPGHRLQILDTISRLAPQNTGHAIPLGPSIRLLVGLISVLLVTLMWARVQDADRTAYQQSAAPVQAGIREAAGRLRQDLTQLEHLAEQQNLTSLQPLLQEFRQGLTELEREDADIRSALRTLSELQAKLAEQHAEFRISLTNDRLHDLGESLSDVTSLQAASTALRENRFSDAAREFRNIRPRRISSSEAQTAAAQMSEVAEAMEDSGLHQLQNLVKQLEESFRDGDASRMQDGGQQLAESLDQHHRSQQVAALLQEQLRRLADYKIAARQTAVRDESLAGGSTEYRQTASARTELAEKGTGEGGADGGDVSGVGSGRSAGAASAGNIDGAPTWLDSERQLARLTGQLSSTGSSTTETVHVTDSAAAAPAEVTRVFAEYRQRSELAVQTEQIPLGHRETIRRYFESLAPRAATRAD